MKTKFYVVFDKNGAQRMTKKFSPSMYRHEIAVCMAVDIPDSVFRAPMCKAEISVPEDRVTTADFDVEVEALDEQKPETE